VLALAVAGTDYQAPGNYITALTTDVVATGPGSVVATIQPGVVTSEDQYIRGRRRDVMREQLTDTLAEGLVPQPSLIETLHRYREETRVIEYITPTFDKVIAIAEPDDSKLVNSTSRTNAVRASGAKPRCFR
jgi:hypothetical protein